MRNDEDGLMETQCNGWQMEFHGLGARRVVGRFDGGRISSDGGSLLLREVEKRTHILKRLAGCFIDHRDPELIEHTVESLQTHSMLEIRPHVQTHTNWKRLRLQSGRIFPTISNSRQTGTSAIRGAWDRRNRRIALLSWHPLFETHPSATLHSSIHRVTRPASLWLLVC